MPTAIDLFAGAGGATQGLKDAGFRVVAAVECDANAVDTFEANHPDVDMRPKDIRDVSPEKLRLRIELARFELTLLTACPPCQGFSTLGSSSYDDERNDLVAQVWRFTREFRPAAVMVENVPGLASDVRWIRLRRQLRAVGYRVRSWIVDAADFGVPQRRRRLIAIAVSEAQAEFPDDLRDVLPPSLDLAAPHASDVIAQAGSIGESKDEWHRARTPTPVVLERIRAIPAGGNHYDLPEALQLACHRRLRRQGRTAATGPYGRIPPEGPAPTMTTRCTTISCGRFVHPTEDRGISLREAALLQTFPPDYAFVGSYESMERQIGNAVPGETIARAGARSPPDARCPWGGAVLTNESVVAETVPRRLRMQYAGGMIQHLGLQMYGGAVPAIAELIANSWDADATRVDVTIPLGTPVTRLLRVEVLDDGVGMSFEEVNDAYLVMGLDRRKAGRDISRDGRRVMGRKGIGKLAGFGIAKNVRVETKKDGHLTIFEMDFDEMTQGDNYVDRYEPTVIHDGPDSGGVIPYSTGTARRPNKPRDPERDQRGALSAKHGATILDLGRRIQRHGQ